MNKVRRYNLWYQGNLILAEASWPEIETRMAERHLDRKLVDIEIMDSDLQNMEDERDFEAGLEP